MFGDVFDFLKKRLTEPGTKKGALALVLWLFARFGFDLDVEATALLDTGLTVVLAAVVYLTKEEPKPPVA